MINETLAKVLGLKLDGKESKMAIDTVISWCDATLNFWWGCTAVAPECRFCYAEKFSKYTGKASWGKSGTRSIVKGTESQLRKLVKIAREAGHKKVAFVSSMSDVFEDDSTFDGRWINHKGETVDTNFEDQRARVFRAIDANPDVHFLLLTKRPQNIRRFVPECVKAFGRKSPYWRPNVSYGTSAGTQRTWNDKVSVLMDCKHMAPSLFVSMEPMMEPINIRGHRQTDLPDVVFIGGESASKADVRPMDVNWVDFVRDQLYGTETIFHFKQLGSYATKNGIPLDYDHPKGEDSTEWPGDLANFQEVPSHWRGLI